MTMSGHVDGQGLPALPVHALSPVHSPFHDPASESIRSPSATEMPRSASYSYFPALEKEPTTVSIRRTFSDNILSLPPETKTKANDTVQSANMELFRRASRKAKKKISGARFSLSPDDDERQPRDNKKSGAEKGEQSRGLGKSVTGTIRTLARKSWGGSSPSSPERKRSWSPGKQKEDLVANSAAVEPATSRPSTSPQREKDDILQQGPSQQARMSPNHSQMSQTQKSLAGLQIKNKSELSLKRLSRASSSTSLGSNERSRSRISLGRVPPLPTSHSSDRLAALNLEVTRRKDPLWSAFRTIDGEFIGFQTRTSLQKSKVLRTVLVPFLQKHAQHPSNKTLRAEDLDRRVVILNKWWTGLLEMLNGAHDQSISGTDRPVFLESASLIMSRPEWRAAGFYCATGESPLRSLLPKSKSSNSLASEEADFLIDSVYQNVRNTFVQNLLSQMAFVVEKLSWRAAPSSLVAFAGKTCAYAFFFCPGVADTLARSWRLPPGTMGRVFTEFDIGYGDKFELISNAIARNFPPPIRSLSVHSQAALSRRLLPQVQIPPGSEKVDWWHKTWIRRWCGRDTDLFFSFTKFYHLLVSEFLPEDLSQKDLAGIPGLVPVCAQMLVVLETTIYRQPGQNHTDDELGGPMFDSNHPDALAPLPMTIPNANRLIAENRLIVLLRDVLGDLNPDLSRFQNLFIGTFDRVTKGVTRRISMHSIDPCFVLCNVMEEVLPILFRYHQSYNDSPVLDWPFWFQVFKQMMTSQSTMAKIRLITLVYSTWSVLVSDEARKRDLILEWLLDPHVFESTFCHWSSMVRHYYYRLLCWRVARYDGPVTELDMEILQTLATRLNKCWAHYQYLSAEAEMRGLPPPSSAPCCPGPSRLLVIMRTDSQPIMNASRTNLDKSLSQSISQSSPYQNHSSLLNSIPSADVPAAGSKKRWSLFRGLAMFGTTPGSGRPGEVTPPGSPEENGSLSSGDNCPGPNSAITASVPAPRPSTPPHQAFSFRFSLEYCPPREHKNRVLIAPQLPFNAQSILKARLSSDSSESGDSATSGSAASGSATSAGSDVKTTARSNEVKPLKPKDHERSLAQNSGRALAEWAQVLNECRTFYGRRKHEGVPRDSLVEIPTLAVENVRMIS